MLPTTEKYKGYKAEKPVHSVSLRELQHAKPCQKAFEGIVSQQTYRLQTFLRFRTSNRKKTN